MESSNNFKKNISIISSGDHYKRNEFATDLAWEEADNAVRISNSDGTIVLKADEILMVARELLNEFDPLRKWYKVADEVADEIVKRWNLLPESIQKEEPEIIPDGLYCLIEHFVGVDEARELVSYHPSEGPQLEGMLEELISNKVSSEIGVNLIMGRRPGDSSTLHYHSVDAFLNYTFLNSSESHTPGMYDPQESKDKVMELVKKVNDKVNLGKASGALYKLLKFGADILDKWDYSVSTYTMTVYSDNYIALLNWMACMDELAHDETTSTILEYELIRNHPKTGSGAPVKPGSIYGRESRTWDFEYYIAENLLGLVYSMTEAIYNYISLFDGNIKMFDSRSKLEELPGELFKCYQF